MEEEQLGEQLEQQLEEQLAESRECSTFSQDEEDVEDMEGGSRIPDDASGIEILLAC